MLPFCNFLGVCLFCMLSPCPLGPMALLSIVHITPPRSSYPLTQSQRVNNQPPPSPDRRCQQMSMPLSPSHMTHTVSSLPIWGSLRLLGTPLLNNHYYRITLDSCVMIHTEITAYHPLPPSALFHLLFPLLHNMQLGLSFFWLHMFPPLLCFLTCLAFLWCLLFNASSGLELIVLYMHIM